LSAAVGAVAGVAAGGLAVSVVTLFKTGVRLGDFGTGCPTGFRGAGAGGVSGAGSGGLLSAAGGAESAARTASPAAAPDEAASLVQPTATMPAVRPVSSMADLAERERNMVMSPVE
jgi:hypothetical protein